MFKSILKLLLLLIIVAFATKANTTDDDDDDDDGSYCDGPDWIQFRDEKCFKLIKKWATQTDAKVTCAGELLSNDSSPPQLASIKSADEQDFLTDYIFNTSGVVINVWTGAKRVPSSNQFVWDDGSSLEDYTNWAEGSPTENDKSACVVMQSEMMRAILKTRRANGIWRDVSCESPHYVVCEKLPRWSIGKLQQTILRQRKKQLVIKNELATTKTDLAATKTELSAAKIELNESIANLNQSIPIGFIYTQISFRKPPTEIWPWMEWTDVSRAFAGLFFRVEGLQSAPFGRIQMSYAPKLDEVWRMDECDNRTKIDIVNQIYGPAIRSGSFGSEKICLQFYSSGGEVRPYNAAMRIWERTG